MKLTNDEINKLLGIKESYQCVEALENILFDKDKKEALFDKILSYEIDVNCDFLRDYFQDEHGDRNKLKQDYTPDCLASLVGKLNNNNNIADLCSGTGALAINQWATNKEQKFYCFEFATRAFVFLLLNLSIRNIEGEASQCDLLSFKFERSYKLVKGEKYSDIIKIDEPTLKVDSIISNPPYSMKWKEVDQYKDDKRFSFGLPPSDKADFAFLLTGLDMLNDNGIAIYILPHGVLFRGNREGIIRQKLVENNLIDAVIGLPDKLFLNTDIPVMLLILKKNRKRNGILFINASKEFEKGGKQNKLLDEHINKILSVYQNRFVIDKYSYIAYNTELKDNEYNLNIPRYVDTWEEPEPIDLMKVVEELFKIEAEEERSKRELAEMMRELVSTRNDEDGKKTIGALNMLADKEAHKEVGLFDVAKVERMKKGVRYPKGCILIQLSASASFMHPIYCENDVLGEEKYAVVIPNEEHNPYYLWQIIDFNYLKFKSKYQTTINTQFEELKHFRFEIHTNRAKQDEVATELCLRELEIKRENQKLEQWKTIKKKLLDVMLVGEDAKAKHDKYKPEPFVEVVEEVKEEPKEEPKKEEPKKEQPKAKKLTKEEREEISYGGMSLFDL